jgi:uncharacterized membrane protein YeaQ/YmgE (transglycosylase-associated protein family)
VRISNAERAAIVLGAADGLTLAISEIMSLRMHETVIFRSGLGAGLGELVGMTAALWLSSDDPQGFIEALACGIATALACVLPCAAFALTTGPAAWAGAAAALAVAGAAVCWIRPQRGIRSVAETYGVLAVAGALCFASSLV